MLKLRHLIINHIVIDDIAMIKKCNENFINNKKIEDVIAMSIEYAPNNTHIHSIIQIDGVMNQTVRDNIKRHFKPIWGPNTNYECVDFKSTRQLEYVLEKKPEQKKVIISRPNDEIVERINEEYPEDKDEFEKYLTYMKQQDIAPVDVYNVSKSTLTYLIEDALENNRKTPYHLTKNKAVFYCCKYSEEFKKQYIGNKVDNFMLECGIKNLM